MRLFEGHGVYAVYNLETSFFEVVTNLEAGLRDRVFNLHWSRFPWDLTFMNTNISDAIAESAHDLSNYSTLRELAREHVR